MSSLTPLDQPHSSAQLEAAENQRIKAVQAIGREGGPEAVRALTRLLAVDTGFQPIKDSRRTMRHAVIEELGRSGDERAAEPLIAAFVDAAEQVKGTSAFLRSTGLSTKAAVAQDTVRTAAAALGSLGGAPATASLTEAAREDRYPRMIRRAASKALS